MERSAIRGSRRAVSRISLRSIRATMLANGSDEAILLFVAIAPDAIADCWHLQLRHL